MQLIEYSAQSNDLAAPLKCSQLHIQREHQHQRSFQLPLKTKVLAPFTTRSTCQLQGRKTQCAENQLTEYSAQSNDLAAPLKCRQLHVQREPQRQRSFQLPLKTKVLAPFTTRSTCSLQGRNSECETASQWKTRFERNPHISHSVYETQCGEKQLIEYFAQSNDLAAPLKCRQLHVQ